LVLLNLPLVIAAVFGIFVDYKLKKIGRRKLVVQLSIWGVILFGLLSASSVYAFLFSRKLTQTEPLSLFDVIQITGIIVVLYMANRARVRIDSLERRITELHKELSITLSYADNQPAAKVKIARKKFIKSTW
jgi:hypothetical protein